LASGNPGVILDTRGRRLRVIRLRADGLSS